MKGTFKLDNPDAMEATMTVTMTLDEWKNLSKRLGQTYVLGQDYIKFVYDLIEESEFTAEGPEGE